MYITTPIFYPTANPHLGHAYTVVLADFYKRFFKLMNYDVKFSTGTDEHGKKIEQTSLKQGISPQNFVDDISAKFRSCWDSMNINYDIFIRTTSELHKAKVTELWNKLVEKDDIYLGKYKGLYCVECEQYYKSGDLVDGCCPIHKKQCETYEEESYFFKLSNYKDYILNYIKDNADFIQPKNRRSEIIAFLENDEHFDLSISRTSFDWGIKVPNDDKHVIYVWFDALFNYVSALGNEFDNYWGDTTHLLGKDILKFHTYYWLAFLKALDIPFPKRIMVHGWWTLSNEKISKSSDNSKGFSLKDLCDEVSVDGLRTYLLCESSFERDSEFNHDKMKTVLNAHLANNIGNLFNRVTSLTNKYFGGKLPRSSFKDNEMSFNAERMKNDFISFGKKYMHANAFSELMKYSSYLNEVITSSEPWKLLKNGETEKAATILANIAEGLRWIAVLGSPFFPEISQKMYKTFFNEYEFTVPTEFSLNEKIVVNSEILFKRLE